jgi:hypothetical protein
MTEQAKPKSLLDFTDDTDYHDASCQVFDSNWLPCNCGYGARVDQKYKDAKAALAAEKVKDNHE